MDLVLGILIIIAVQLVLFLVLRARIEQELNATTLLKDVRDEVDGMVRELNLSAERNIGLLEARIADMESLLAQADQKMVLMARELDRRDKTSGVYSQLRRATVPEPEPAPEPEVEPVFELAPPPAPKPVVEPVKPRPLKDRVLDLRDQGQDAAAIASSTGATRAEVELILSLNPRERG